MPNRGGYAAAGEALKGGTSGAAERGDEPARKRRPRQLTRSQGLALPLTSVSCTTSLLTLVKSAFPTPSYGTATFVPSLPPVPR